MHHLVMPCTVRCLAIMLFSAFVALLATPAYAQTEVPSNWPLKPPGLNVGDEFRLLFMGKNSRAADSTDVAVYDAYVQGRIAGIGHAEIKAYASHFKVLGSTAAVNARTHTGTTGTGGVPIYWLDGPKVADNYADFYDGSWNDKDGATLEDGTSLSSGRKDQFICTGTNDDGTTASQPLGAATCAGTKINISGNTLSGATGVSSAASRYLVLSGVFRVGNFTATIPTVESVRVTSDAGSDGEYVKDDAIKVTVTFSEAVAVTGTPKIKLRLSEEATPKRPGYVAAESTATALVFSYTVKAKDYSYGGVIIPRNGIVLSGGATIKDQAGTVDADLDHAKKDSLSAHKVHVRPLVTGVTVASTPAANGIYRTGETIQIDLTFDKEVAVFTDFGTPEVWFVMDDSNPARREAAYTTTVGDHVVRFDYAVQAADLDDDGILFMNNAIVWNDGAIIRKAHGDVDDLDELKTLRVDENGGSTSTYSQTGHRVNAAVSTDATLGDLTLDDGNGADTPMNPAFASTTTSYTASVAYAVDEITIVPTVNEIHATVAYLDASDTALTDADANKNGFQTPLAAGANTIKVKVTADDDFTTLTYTITVTRGAASTDATLSALALTDAANGNTIFLTPGGNRTYTTSVISSVDEITVLPTVSESNATVAYLNASDTALTDADVAKDDFQVALAVGANTIKVKVTAEDGDTIETYTVVVTRAALVPGQVTGVEVTPGTGRLKVDWDAVTNADGYKVQWKSGTETFTNAAANSREATVTSGSTTSHTITGLTNGTAYDVQVIATRTNAADETPSAPASGTPGAAPGQVTGVEVTPGTGRLKVDWDAVTNADGYKVQWKSGAETFADAAANSREATVTSGSTTSHTITGLTNGTAYDVQVIATRTNADDGTPSAPATDTPSQTVRITGVAFTNVPSNNVYNLGDTIEVSITFNAAVEVTGTPKVQMYFVDKHKFYEYANYDAASSTDTVLVFKRLVTGDDDNESTVRVIPDGLKLNGGTIRIKGTTVNADIAHAGTQTEPDINTRWLEGIAVTSAPAVPETVTGNPVYGPGEKIQFRVTFKNAVDVDQTDGALKLKFRSGSATATYAADYESGTGTKDLVFAWTVPANMPDDGAGLVVPTNVHGHGHGFDTSHGLVLNGGTIKSTGGIAVNIRHGQYDTDSRVDTTAPVLAAGADGATVDGTALVLTFQNPDEGNSADHLDEASAPAPADFAVTFAGSARTVSSVNVNGATVTLTLASPAGHAQAVTLGYTPGTSRIRDRWGNEAVQIASRSVRNDSPEPSLSIEPVTVDESDGTATFTVTLSVPSAEQVTVDYATGDGTATAGADYTAANGTLTFAPGETTKPISVTIADDTVDEDGETFSVTLSNAVNASIGQAAAAGTITDDDQTALFLSGQVTELMATATVNKVTLTWTAPSGTILGYRIEASYDGGTVWAEVEDNTNGTSTAYAHGSGLMAGETRDYRVSAITGDGAGPPSVAAAANASDTVNGLTATGVSIQDTPDGMATIDLCWKPSGVAVSELKDFAIRERNVHPSYPAEWSDQHWSPSGKSRAADCEAGSIGFRVSGRIAPNIRYAFQIRARYGMRWALSNDADAVSVDAALDLRADVLTGNSSLSGDTDVPATVCPAYDDPATPEADAGSFIVNIGFSTRPAVMLNYEAVTGFVLDNDVTLENATAELIDRPYGAQLGYRVRIAPTTWGQPVAVSVPAGVVTHPASSVRNQASNVFRRNTSASTDCDTGSDITVYPPAVRRTAILDDDDRSGMWSTGERVRATLEFTESVTVTTDNGIPTVSLSIDGKTVQASYAEGTGGDTLAFEHVVTAEQSPFNSASLVANSLSLNGGAIASPDGPAATLAHPGAVKQKKLGTGPKKPATEPKLTAEWVKFPPGHSGDGRKFTVRVKFSDPVTINVRYFRDYALSVTGGVVDKLWRVKGSDGEPRKDLWAIRVMPASQQPLSLSLAAIQDCSQHGAICTADGTPLSNAASITVTGPNHDLTVADAEAEEAPGAELAFVVTLSGTAPYRVKVDYRTADDTATAGEDYTAVEGTLIFERGETSKTVSVPVLDDAHDDDGETLTLSLSNPLRAMIVDGEAVGTIRNNDPMPRAWLARFGRTVADQVLAAVEGRLKAARVPGVEAQLAGQRIAGPAAPDTEKAHEAEAEARLLALSDWLRGAACPDESERQGECALGGQARFDSRKLTGRDFLTGSSFTLTGGTREGGVGALWAQGTVGRFEGREGALSLDGEVLSGMLGADWTRGRGTAGFVLAHSRGDGDYRSESGGGEVSSTLTGIYPYGRYAVNERLSMWGIVGYGAGELGLTPEGSSRLEADIDLAMAAAGARSTVLDGGDNGPTAALTADALIVRTKADGAPGPAASKAEVTRLRLGLEGSWPFPLEGGALVTPSVEIGLRQDGGDAEAGFGADIGAGLAWEDPQRGLKAEVRGRGLLTHEDANFRERGFAASFAWNPTPGSKLGPSLTLRQSVGASATGGMDALLSRGTMAGVATNDNRENVARRLEVKLGYGLPVAGDRFIGTPEIGVGFSDTGREYSLGWGLGLARRDRGSLDLSLEGTRHESANGDRGPEHGIGLRLRARW